MSTAETLVQAEKAEHIDDKTAGRVIDGLLRETQVGLRVRAVKVLIRYLGQNLDAITISAVSTRLEEEFPTACRAFEACLGIFRETRDEPQLRDLCRATGTVLAIIVCGGFAQIANMPPAPGNWPFGDPGTIT